MSKGDSRLSQRLPPFWMTHTIFGDLYLFTKALAPIGDSRLWETQKVFGDSHLFRRGTCTHWRLISFSKTLTLFEDFAPFSWLSLSLGDSQARRRLAPFEGRLPHIPLGGNAPKRRRGQGGWRVL